METLNYVMRFLHISGAIVGLGGLIVAAAVLPRLDGDARDIVSRQAGKWIGIGLTVAILAGGYNASVQWRTHMSSDYRTTLLVKGVLGMLVYIFSIFVFHKARAFRSFAERRTLWAVILIVAGLLVVALGDKLHTYYAPSDRDAIVLSTAR